MKSRLSIITLLMAVVVTSGCTTNVRTPTNAQNPAPLEPFSKFSSFELKPINTAEDCAKQRGADVALTDVQGQLNWKLGPMVKDWNSKTASGTRKLLIEPICSDVKLVGTAGRILAGALAGSSAIVMKMRYTEADTGKIIAEPVFYQRANAMGAAYSFGGTDRNMAARISELMIAYARNNYDAAVGGPTGSADVVPVSTTKK
ncbi:hypothetical protein LG201_01555 [Methylobacillus gramineus]|uniref:hypothetical protein n=1 Tax=Methylobacillus gramineus TaxID=755169 RepID=UPI001D0009D5|nr:hypothetical protein [Methylobacillus gramineus]MCB5183887.1 hypothetical protein [Methylobacillus gramineus]